jgi:hypothetical protein
MPHYVTCTNVAGYSFEKVRTINSNRTNKKDDIGLFKKIAVDRGGKCLSDNYKKQNFFSFAKTDMNGTQDQLMSNEEIGAGNVRTKQFQTRRN